MELFSYYNFNRQSQISALMATSGLKSDLARRILECLAAANESGMTCEELETATGIPGNSARPRLLNLKSKGLIYRNKLTRMNKSQRPAEVWVLNLKP